LVYDFIQTRCAKIVYLPKSVIEAPLICFFYVQAKYPYDDSDGSKTPDDQLFQHLARTYALNHGSMFTGMSGCGNFPEGITNGAKWHIVQGGMQDFKSEIFLNVFLRN
jgi:hypothetical protein